MDVRTYERLSRVYDLDWGDFSMQYVEIISQLLKQRQIDQAHILDLACGTGTLIIALARRGHICLGIDRSLEMIAIAKDKANSITGLEFDIQDIQNLRLQGAFDLVTCTFDSINYLTDLDDVGNMMTAAASVLHSGGLFIFDTNTRLLYKNNDGFSHAYEFGQVRIIQRMHYDSRRNRAETVFEFGDGSREIHLQRPYGLRELKPLLRYSGFSVVSMYGGFRERKANRNSERLIFITTKR
jgi:SAM-dependent methyltransferase